MLGALTFLAAAQSPWPIHDKTLVAWAEPDGLAQRGGSVLTIEKSGGVFDAIVFGEISPTKWMAGSEFFHRTPQDQSSFPSQTDKGLVEVAVVYHGNQVTIFRDGMKATTYSVTRQESFGQDSRVLIGLRHTDAQGDNKHFVGSVAEARIYATALTDAQVAGLKPHEANDPKPLAWWDFQDGRITDRMGAFPATTLVGDAKVSGGRLHLSSGSTLMAATHGPETQDVNATARALRERLLSDPYRPGYHFVIPEGTAMPFDPNGAIYWKGQYHLFYIYQDQRGHNWGHVSSTDLFHWRQHPTGLVSGMFSGNCFVNKDGVPTMCYHQVDQGNAMAVALDDDLDTWKKLDSNPITPKTQPGDPFDGKYRSWDPYGWIEDGHYYAIFGGNRPAVAKSDRLEGPWQYVGDLMGNTIPGVAIDEDVSCADFFKLGDKRMLLCISHRLGCRYYLGEWKDEQFHPTFHEKMSWVDNSFFAPESLLDGKGRRIMWAWIFDQPGFGTRTDMGWSGTMSLPRVLSLGPDGMLRMDVPEEIERLRYRPVERAGVTVAADKEAKLDGFSGNSIEVDAEFAPGHAKQVGLKVCCSPGGEEETLVYYDSVEHKLKVDTARSSLSERSKSVEAGPLTLAPNEPLRLRVFVDRSVVEVFANGRQAVMRRVYPSRKDSLGVRLFATGGAATCTRVRQWTMMPSNPY